MNLITENYTNNEFVTVIVSTTICANFFGWDTKGWSNVFPSLRRCYSRSNRMNRGNTRLNLV